MAIDRQMDIKNKSNDDLLESDVKLSVALTPIHLNKRVVKLDLNQTIANNDATFSD
jgi:hypothetical protein